MEQQYNAVFGKPALSCEFVVEMTDAANAILDVITIAFAITRLI